MTTNDFGRSGDRIISSISSSSSIASPVTADLSDAVTPISNVSSARTTAVSCGADDVAVIEVVAAEEDAEEEDAEEDGAIAEAVAFDAEEAADFKAR